MARIPFKDVVRDDQGDASGGVSVEVRDGAGVLVSPLYAAATGGTVLTNPLTSDATTGIVEFWIDETEQGVLFFTIGSGASEVTYPVVVGSTISVISDLDFQGGWDASSGSFPTSTTAGEYWIVETAGTVDGVTFAVNDELIALVDAASTSTYSGNWFKKAGGTVTTADLALKADIASPTFTGTPAAPTAAYGTNTTQIATSAFVQSAIDGLTSLSFDLGSATDTPTGHTAISNWSTRVTETRGTGTLDTTQTQVSALMYGPLPIAPAVSDWSSRRMVADLDVIDGGAANYGWGVMIVASDFAGGSFPTDSSMTAWVLRENGAVAAYTDAGGSTVTGAAARVGSPTITGVSWSVGDALQVQADPLPGGGGTLRWFVDGVVVATVTIDADYWAEGAMPAPVVYFSSSGGDVQFSSMTATTVVQADEVLAAPYIDGAAASSGSGKPGSPLKTLSEGITAIDATADTLVMTVKDGTYALTEALSFDPRRFKSVRIRAQNGARPIIRTTLAAGTWTVDGSNPTVWWCDHYWGGVASTSASGGVVQMDSDEVDGVPVRAFKYVAPNTAAATLATETVPAYSVNTSLGRMYVVIPDSTDPNTLTLHLSQAGSVIEAQTPADWYASEMILEGLRLQGAYSAGIQAARWKVVAEDTHVAGCMFDGWSLDECMARLYACAALGCGNDGVNMNPSGGGATVDPAHLIAWDFVSRGHVVGDGLSNHVGGGDIILHGGWIGDVGKDGLSMGQGGALYGTTITDCADTGVKLYAAGRVDASGLLIRDSVRGVQITRSSGSDQSLVRLSNSAIIGGDRALYTFNTTGTASLATIEAYGVGCIGQATAAEVNGGGVITRPTLAYS